MVLLSKSNSLAILFGYLNLVIGYCLVIVSCILVIFMLLPHSYNMLYVFSKYRAPPDSSKEMAGLLFITNPYCYKYNNRVTNGQKNNTA